MTVIKRIALVVLAMFSVVAVIAIYVVSKITEAPIPATTSVHELAALGKVGPVGLVYHVRISDQAGFHAWQQSLAERVVRSGGRRLFVSEQDPAPGDPTPVDVVLIDELPSAALAAETLEYALDQSAAANERLSVLVIDPIASVVLKAFPLISGVASAVAPLEEQTGVQAATETGARIQPGSNREIWGSDGSFEQALSQDLSAPLFMYNLNKFNSRANYGSNEHGEDANVSGREAYSRYGRPMDQFRRGSYPFYMGNVVGQFSANQDDPLADHWDQFILVYYPERRILFDMIRSQPYRDRAHHRDAALARASLRFLTLKTAR